MVQAEAGGGSGVAARLGHQLHDHAGDVLHQRHLAEALALRRARPLLLVVVRERALAALRDLHQARAPLVHRERLQERLELRAVDVALHDRLHDAVQRGVRGRPRRRRLRSRRRARPRALQLPVEQIQRRRELRVVLRRGVWRGGARLKQRHLRGHRGLVVRALGLPGRAASLDLAGDGLELFPRARLVVRRAGGFGPEATLNLPRGHARLAHERGVVRRGLTR